MKKNIVLLVLLSVLTFGVYAEQADYFSFTIGSGAGYDVKLDEVVATSVFGVDYTFNSTFNGGFKFVEVGSSAGKFISISVIPSDDLHLTIYSGKLVTDVAFGLGLSYDLFSKKDALFSNMSINIDWFASDGGVYPVDGGGVILLGLRTQVGL